MAAWPYNTRRWQALRLAKLAESPLCEDHLERDRIVAAAHVDHRIAIAAGGPAFPPLSGLRSLCAPCHSAKTNAHDRDGGRGFMPGCDVDGVPLDPRHPGITGKLPKPRATRGRGGEALGRLQRKTGAHTSRAVSFRGR